MTQYYRLNHNITAKEVRLLDETGKQVGISSKDEALARAKELGVDLVEIAPKALPPVCKLIDFKKFKYQESKKEREIKKKAKTVELKQLRLRPFIGEHDFEVRVRRAKEFLQSGDRIKVIVQFFGREMAHKEFGFNILNKFTSQLVDLASREREPKFEGRTLVAYYSPAKKKKNEEENEKSSLKAVQNNKDRKNTAAHADVKTPAVK